mgnify:CR=1 FL=1
MTSLSATRAAIKATVEANVAGLVGYDKIRDAVNPPCFVVAPADSSFDKAFGRGLDLWSFDLIVLVTRGEAESAQDKLDVSSDNNSMSKSPQTMAFRRKVQAAKLAKRQNGSK